MATNNGDVNVKMTMDTSEFETSLKRMEELGRQAQVAMQSDWDNTSLSVAGSLVKIAEEAVKVGTGISSAMDLAKTGASTLSGAFNAVLGPIGLVITAVSFAVDAYNDWKESYGKLSDEMKKFRDDSVSAALESLSVDQEARAD